MKKILAIVWTAFDSVLSHSLGGIELLLLHMSLSQQKVTDVLQIPKDHFTHMYVWRPNLLFVPQLPSTHSTDVNDRNDNDDPYQHFNVEHVLTINKKANARLVILSILASNISKINTNGIVYYTFIKEMVKR